MKKNPKMSFELEAIVLEILSLKAEKRPVPETLYKKLLILECRKENVRLAIEDIQYGSVYRAYRAHVVKSLVIHCQQLSSLSTGDENALKKKIQVTASYEGVFRTLTIRDLIASNRTIEVDGAKISKDGVSLHVGGKPKLFEVTNYGYHHPNNLIAKIFYQINHDLFSVITHGLPSPTK